MSTRTFVVRVSEDEPRVVVEDVRTGERVLAAELASVGQAIARLIEPPRGERDPPSPSGAGLA